MRSVRIDHRHLELCGLWSSLCLEDRLYLEVGRDGERKLIRISTLERLGLVIDLPRVHLVALLRCYDESNGSL